MEIFFNELSTNPKGADEGHARGLITGMLETMQQLQQRDHNVMRTHDGFYNLEVAADYNFAKYLRDEQVPLTLRMLLQSIVKSPYLDDDSIGVDRYILQKIVANDHLGNPVCPDGLAAAFANDAHALSLNTHIQWRQRTIPIQVSSDNDEFLGSEILNFWDADSVRNWKEVQSSAIFLNTEENIKKKFPESQYLFEARAMEEMIDWYYDGDGVQNRIIRLIEDIAAHPFNGGLGKTEFLLHDKKGMASKRITGRDRLTYTYTATMITIHSCRGHYDDH